MRRRNESNFGQQRTRQQGISTVGNTLVFGQQDTFQQHQDQATFFQNTPQQPQGEQVDPNQLGEALQQPFQRVEYYTVIEPTTQGEINITDTRRQHTQIGQMEVGGNEQPRQPRVEELETIVPPANEVSGNEEEAKKEPQGEIKLGFNAGSSEDERGSSDDDWHKEEEEVRGNDDGGNEPIDVDAYNDGDSEPEDFFDEEHTTTITNPTTIKRNLLCQASPSDMNTTGILVPADIIDRHREDPNYTPTDEDLERIHITPEMERYLAAKQQERINDMLQERRERQKELQERADGRFADQDQFWQNRLDFPEDFEVDPRKYQKLMLNDNEELKELQERADEHFADAIQLRETGFEVDPVKYQKLMLNDDEVRSEGEVNNLPVLYYLAPNPQAEDAREEHERRYEELSQTVEEESQISIRWRTIQKKRVYKFVIEDTEGKKLYEEAAKKALQLEKENKQIQGQLKDHKEYIKALANSQADILTKANEDIRYHEKMNRLLTRDNEELKEEVKKGKQEKKDMAAANAELLTEINQKYRDTEALLEGAQWEKEQLRRKNEQLEIRGEKLREVIEEKDKTIDEQNERIKEKDEKIEELKRQNERLLREFNKRLEEIELAQDEESQKRLIHQAQEIKARLEAEAEKRRQKELEEQLQRKTEELEEQFKKKAEELEEKLKRKALAEEIKRKAEKKKLKEEAQAQLPEIVEEHKERLIQKILHQGEELAEEEVRTYVEQFAQNYEQWLSRLISDLESSERKIQLEPWIGVFDANALTFQFNIPILIDSLYPMSSAHILEICQEVYTGQLDLENDFNNFVARLVYMSFYVLVSLLNEYPPGSTTPLGWKIPRTIDLTNFVDIEHYIVSHYFENMAQMDTINLKNLAQDITILIYDRPNVLKGEIIDRNFELRAQREKVEELTQEKSFLENKYKNLKYDLERLSRSYGKQSDEKEELEKKIKEMTLKMEEIKKVLATKRSMKRNARRT